MKHASPQVAHRRRAATPDRRAALDQYRRRAGIYDFEMALIEPVRWQAVARLGLVGGETVIDVGCGTGLSFELLQERIGPQGRILAIEQCPEMIAQAEERVQRHGWRNVQTVCAPVEAARIALRADAALFHFTHDILRRPEAVANVVRHLRPGARVVAAGLKWAEPWAWPANLFVLPAALHSVTSLEGLARPWDRLAEALGGELQVQPALLGGGYLALGTKVSRSAH